MGTTDIGAPLEKETDRPLTPFLKWPGGKRWFVANYAEVLPKRFNTYIEPFLGSGSVYFHLRPDRALLGDWNPELIAAYMGVRNRWRQTEDLLRQYNEDHGYRHYYRVRKEQPRSRIRQAARVIYLNRTCFNGIYRVNQDGKFNVPKGTKDSVLFETDDFEATSRLLRTATLHCCDFKFLVDKAKADDLIFADPPYTVRHNLNGFIKYNETLFSWNDQIRLADALAGARNRGAAIVSTNANHDSVRSLYRERAFELRTVSRFSPISADPKSRRQFEELLILSK